MYVVHGLVEESLRRGGDFVTRQVRWCWRFFVIVDGVWFPGCVAWYVVSRCVEGCIVCLDVGLLVCACGMHWQRLVSFPMFAFDEVDQPADCGWSGALRVCPHVGPSFVGKALGESFE